MLRRNFTLDHLAQIKNVYENAFVFHQEKMHNFGSSSKQDKYELVITPLVQTKGGRSTPDADNVLKSASQMSMCPTVLLERRRIFYNALLGEIDHLETEASLRDEFMIVGFFPLSDLVKNQHEKFLMGLDPPMVLPKDKITRWHPEFDIENCEAIGKSELPEAPNVEKLTTAQDVLRKFYHLATFFLIHRKTEIIANLIFLCHIVVLDFSYSQLKPDDTISILGVMNSATILKHLNSGRASADI